MENAGERRVEMTGNEYTVDMYSIVQFVFKQLAFKK